MGFVVSASALAACRPCPTFDEMVVTNPTGVATQAELDLVAATIAGFAAATGREGVCVPEIRVLPEAADPELFGFDGYYTEPHAPIVVATDNADLARTTRHELCHALDQVEGLHDGRHDLFPPESLREDYAHDLGVGEVFARECAVGAAGIAIAKPLYDDCGFPAESATAAYLLDAVYAGAPEAPVVPLDIARWRVERDLPDGAVRLASAVSGTDRVVLAGLGPAEVGVYRTDAASGERTGHARVAGPSLADWRLLVGDGAVVAVSDSGPRVAWRLDAAGAPVALVGFPRTGPGTLADGHAWVSDDGGISVYDLDAGTSVDVAWPDGLTPDVTGWASTGGAVVGASIRDGLLVRAGDAWVVHSGPDALFLGGTALAGDRWVVTSTFVDTYDFYRNRITTLLLFDREAEAWAVPLDACGLDGSYEPVVVGDGDAAWVYDFGADPFGDLSTEYLARISVE